MAAWWGRVRPRPAGIVVAGAVLAPVIPVPAAAADPPAGVTYRGGWRTRCRFIEATMLATPRE
ncbi:hypothetical protein BKM31_12745 [[Actinomadura] parvosata subsp. kistnae]|uniref:Uncharacterized protein n=1 Tax=[Actinomadura] parvosata subsp. kistnae TaxID=1909395 RepID=A0A1U9ZWD3_9ACTN|nr:hypothetical protein BKM31_12745 [Nonomuraea sp. ATCC 55076]